MITVRTPEPAFDAMLNRWTLYQALACRMWARSALYQSSGAYGFRDQLQDVLAFVYAEPAVARAHLLRAAARQFVEGDVQHWWHPHTRARASAPGSRTTWPGCPTSSTSTSRVTGDEAVLDEAVPFLAMRAARARRARGVRPAPRSPTRRPACTSTACGRCGGPAPTGAHGLPLIGIGDWNDGMSRVGVEGGARACGWPGS